MPKIKQSVKRTGRARKELIVAQLVEKIDKSNGLVFTDYKGITHKQLEDLKRELKTMEATIIIAKNSLLKISLGKSQRYADFKDNEGLEAPTATLFIQGDMVEPLKRLQKVIKEINLPKIKFGVLEGQLVDESGVLKIAALPNRDTLIAQFVGTLNSPIQGLVVTLNGTIQKLVMTLDAVAKSKPAATPGPAAIETPETPSDSAVPSADGATEKSADQPETQSETPTANDSADEPTKVPTENAADTKTTEEESTKPEKPETVENNNSESQNS